jgi:hypothetical protein
MSRLDLSSLRARMAAASFVAALSLVGVVGSTARLEARAVAYGTIRNVGGYQVCDCTLLLPSGNCACHFPY